MKARAERRITEIPIIAAGTPVTCLNSIKSAAQILFSLQELGSESVESCLPSADLDWLEVLEHVILYMDSQPKDSLADKDYGYWIMQSLNNKYPS